MGLEKAVLCPRLCAVGLVDTVLEIRWASRVLEPCIISYVISRIKHDPISVFLVVTSPSQLITGYTASLKASFVCCGLLLWMEQDW